MADIHPSRNVYQLSGLDGQERGFTRQVEVSSDQSQYRAVFWYEKLRVVGEPCLDEEAALQEIISRLHGLGYTQLRTQLVFRGAQYLGSQEMWVDYPDKRSSLGFKDKILTLIERWFE